MFRRFRIVACSLIVLFGTVQVGQAQTLELEARIGAWNLGAKGGGGERFIEKSRIPSIAQMMAMLGPDVLAVSEITPKDRLNLIIKHLKVAGLCYRRQMVDQPSKLNVAFLYRCHVKASNARLIPGSGYELNGRDNRQALAVDFKVGNFDFTAIVVHFKSGRSGNSRDLRTEQVGKVWDFIKDEVLPTEKDVLIMGDYNMIPGPDEENFKALNPENTLRFITNEELEPRDGFGKVFSHIGNRGRAGNLLDGFAISRIHTAEYRTKSVRIVPMDLFVGSNLKRFKGRYSDHLPLMAVFTAHADDD